MEFNHIFEKINDKNQYLVVNDLLKQKMVYKKSQYEIKHKKILMFKILTKSELIDLLSFHVDLEIYVYHLEKNKQPLSITKEMIKFSKYNLLSKHTKLNDFIADSKPFIKQNELFKNKLNEYTFHILENDCFLTPFIKHFNLNAKDIQIDKTQQPTIHTFVTQEEEIFYLLENIAKLIDDGININNIYVANTNQNYIAEIKRIAKFYHIPFALNEKESLYQIPYIKDILNKPYKEILHLLSDKELLDESYQKVKNIDKMTFDQHINQLIKIINKYQNQAYSDTTLKTIILEDTKNTFIQDQFQIKDAVKVIHVEEIIGLEENDKVFILNAAYEAFPVIAKDNDYLSDEEKRYINYPDSEKVNINRQNYLEKIINLKQVQYISISSRDRYNTYTPSDLVVKYKSKNHADIKMDLNDLTKGYAVEYYKQFFSSKTNDVLLTTFTGDYQLNAHEKEEIASYIKQKDIKISPSQIAAYYQLPFVYYLEKILGLSSFTKNINNQLGDFFHSLIEILMILLFEEKVDRSTSGKKQYVKDDIVNEKIFQYILKKEVKDINTFNINQYVLEFYDIYFYHLLKHRDQASIKNYEDQLEIKTLFYVKKHLKSISKALEVIVELEMEVPSEVLLIESKIVGDHFSGQADLIKLYENQQYSIIDYKTGSRVAFKVSAIMDLIDTLLLDDDSEISFDTLKLLQLVLYAYLFQETKPQLKLKDLAYFSYFTEKLNGMTTTGEFGSSYYALGKIENRTLNEEELKDLFIKIKQLLEQTLNHIQQADFPIIIRRDLKSKKGRDKDYYSVYEALAFYQNNTHAGDINEDE